MLTYVNYNLIFQTHSEFVILQDENFFLSKDKALQSVKDVKDTYRPQRHYKRHDAASIGDEETRVHSTLLEYGRLDY